MRLPKNFARSSLASRKAHAFKSSMTANSSESPFNRFKRWFDAARRAGEPCPEAMALATADPGGGGAVRFVLLKEIDARGFVFYTDLRSRKGRDLLSNPRAALGFYWHKTGRQVRVEGKVERVDDVTADTYWSTRPIKSTISASVSRQSSPLSDRASLVEAAHALYRRLKGRRPARPSYWTGLRVVPKKIEFWTSKPNRLHERELFVAKGDRWYRRLLQP